MKKSILSRQELHEYCLKVGIIVPKTATRDTLEAAIARAALHGSEPESDREIGCFGFHDATDGNCITCLYQEPCALSSLGGMTVKSCQRALAKLDNPRVRFEPLRKTRAK